MHDVGQLQNVVSALTRHVRFPLVPSVEVVGDREYPVLDLQTGAQYTRKVIDSAGDIHWDNPLAAKIRVGISQCYYPRRLGHILAHEVTHCVLDWRGVRAASDVENEMLTDLAAVWIGFGKLMLNDVSDGPNSEPLQPIRISEEGQAYLGYPLLAYGYVHSLKPKDVSSSESYEFLTQPAAKLVRAFDYRDSNRKGLSRLMGYLHSLVMPEPNTDGIPLARDLWKRDPDRHTIISCPKCGANLRLPKTNRTLEVRCPRCGNRFDVGTRFGQGYA
jgi:hypothetical protein